MSKVMQLSDPLRADHRMIKNLIHTLGKTEKVQHLPHEYAWVVGCFEGLRGSWKGVAEGAIDHVSLLKKVIKHAIKAKKISPAPNWPG